MKISVWDTYVARGDGSVMHFDILVPEKTQDANIVYRYGDAYLQTKTFETGHLTSKECQYCHVEEASPEVEANISKQGFHIIEMENCS